MEVLFQTEDVQQALGGLRCVSLLVMADSGFGGSGSRYRGGGLVNDIPGQAAATLALQQGRLYKKLKDAAWSLYRPGCLARLAKDAAPSVSAVDRLVSELYAVAEQALGSRTTLPQKAWECLVLTPALELDLFMVKHGKPSCAWLQSFLERMLAQARLALAAGSAHLSLSTLESGIAQLGSLACTRVWQCLLQGGAVKPNAESALRAQQGVQQATELLLELVRAQPQVSSLYADLLRIATGLPESSGGRKTVGSLRVLLLPFVNAQGELDIPRLAGCIASWPLPLAVHLLQGLHIALAEVLQLKQHTLDSATPPMLRSLPGILGHHGPASLDGARVQGWAVKAVDELGTSALQLATALLDLKAPVEAVSQLVVVSNSLIATSIVSLEGWCCIPCHASGRAAATALTELRAIKDKLVRRQVQGMLACAASPGSQQGALRYAPSAPPPAATPTHPGVRRALSAFSASAAVHVEHASHAAQG